MRNNIPNPPANAYIPIWIDTYYRYRNSLQFQYNIRCDGEIIFNGIAYSYPNNIAPEATVNVNKICEHYLNNDLTILDTTSITGSTYLTDAAKTFELYLGGAIAPSATYKFYWNYNTNRVIYSGNISEPINGHYISGMFRLNSSVDSNGVNIEWNKRNATWRDYTVEGCGDYALYYLNRNGGWDSFLIEGKVKEKDSYNKSTFERKPNQQLYYSREVEIFHNIIEHSYELNTGWLKDSESKTLAYHLLSSNKVYLHDLNNDTIIPVNITDSSCEYKTFKNDRRLISYTINVKESNKDIIL